jgi:hypothetical protein
MIRVVHAGDRIPDPDPDFLPIPYTRSRGKKRHRIPDPDPGSGSPTLKTLINMFYHCLQDPSGHHCWKVLWKENTEAYLNNISSSQCQVSPQHFSFLS